MKYSDYRALDATALAAGIDAGTFTAAEVLAAARARLRQVNPLLNAVVLDLGDAAEQALAHGVGDGPLAGVPLLVKDMDGTLAGHRCTYGSRSRATWVPDHDSELFARYRAAGVLFTGKTNCPEFGIMGITEPKLHGPTRNPWNIERTPGGSSGGSAAAVAAGVVPVAHAGDGGGSIRIPSAYCGLVGLKPSRGRTPMGPDVWQGWGGLVASHVVSRTVRDSALFLAVGHGADAGAPYDEPGGDAGFVAAAGREPGRLRVGVMRTAFLADAQDPEITAAVESTAALLADLGHDVVDLELRLDREAVAQAYLTIVAAAVAVDIAHTRRRTGVDPSPGLFEPETWFLGQVGRGLSAADLAEAHYVIGALARSVAVQLAGVDVHLSATTAQHPARIGELAPGRTQHLALSALRRVGAVAGATLQPVLRQALRQLAADSLARTPNTQVFNMTGQPAVSLPLAWSGDGLPIGLQFAAGMGREALLFSLAGQLERARPWADRHPPL